MSIDFPIRFYLGVCNYEVGFVNIGLEEYTVQSLVGYRSEDMKDKIARMY